LLLRLVVPAKLWVNPPSLFVFHPGNNTETTEKEFIVCDSRGNRFDITDASVNTELVEAIVGETGRTAMGNFQQSVLIRVAAKLPAGRRTHLLTIKTTDPDAPELRIPLMLEGESVGEIEPTLDHEQSSVPLNK
jgi:hypothetical protein